MRKKILIIPDRIFGDNYSGAIAARVLSNLLIKMGHIVGIYSVDVSEDLVDENFQYFYRSPLNYRALYMLSPNDKSEFNSVIKRFNPDIVFSIGSVTNRNPVYLDICIKLKIKTITMIFMQDFFCIKSYPNSAKGVCVDCLNGKYSSIISNKCGINNSTDYFKVPFRIIQRNLLKNLLRKTDIILGSSIEQLEFYSKCGINKEKQVQIPLFFDRDRLEGLNSDKGDTFLCIAQNRLEKGFHFLPEILKNYSFRLKVKVAYPGVVNEQILSRDGIIDFVKEGKIIIIENSNWKTTLPIELSKTFGVIMPTIWPTTTEFAMLESLGLKKPIFAFDVGIHKEIICNYENGFIVPINQAHILSKYMDDLIDDDIKYKNVSDGSYKLYEELIDENNWISILNKIT